MCNDRICTVYDGSIITTFVEHTHVGSQNVCHVDSTSHTAFVRADDHHGVFVRMKIRNCTEQTFDKLVNRLNGLKTFQRDCILHTRVVSIKGNDIVNAHADQFVQCQCTVQRFSSGTFVLTALVKERHDDIDTSCFSAYCCDDTLQILKMVIR